MSGWRQRSAEEREAARLERERRRAQRHGTLEPEPIREPDPVHEPESVHEPEPVYQPEPIHQPEPVHQSEPAPLHEPESGSGVPFAALDGDQSVDDSYDEPFDDPYDETPAGTRRVAGVSRERFTRKRPRHSRIGRIVSILAIALGAVLIWFLFELFQPFHGSGHGSVTVRIPAHSSSSQIGDVLASDGVIASSFFFELRATLAGQRSDLRPGTYHMKLDMSYGSVLKVLTTAPRPAKVTELTITEGRTRRQVDALLRKQGVRGSYAAATRHSRLLDPARYGAPRRNSSLEGFLFPSTYQLREPISVSALVADQLRTFRQRFAGVNLSYARSKHLTPYDVLTIASMVDAEAQTEHDRPLIASVIYNRLAAGMPLQIDATTRYETGNYTRPLTVSQLSSSSPYNTRIHKGLPPTPIDNPGLPSIEAAAHPKHTRFLYFVVKPCGNGEQVFSSSYAQFLKDVQRYQTARARRGGSPVHC